MSPVASFDEIVRTDPERDALEHLRSATGQAHGPMERHCLRCLLIAGAIAERRGWTLDGELMTVASILHDAGLYPQVSRGGVYTADGARLAEEITRQHGWPEERRQRCADAIDRHHDLRSQLSRGPEVEALRLADLVDVSGGLVRFGLERGWLRELAATIPRRGLGRELWREVSRALRERPATMPRIFLRP